MGVLSLETDDGDGLDIESEDLRRVLSLAGLFGWHDPTAARELLLAGDGHEDDVGVLSAAQAGLLAAALEQTLDDIPNHDAMRHKLLSFPTDQSGFGWLEEDPKRPLSPLEWFSGEGKGFVRALAALCRRGKVRAIREP